MVGSKPSKTRACPNCKKPSWLNINGGRTQPSHEYYCRECKRLFYIKNKYFKPNFKLNLCHKGW